MKNFEFINKNDNKKIVCYLWNNVQNPKALIQISHGMAEYLIRYDEFAQYLNNNGFLVFGDDHRGHGLTAGSEENFGITEENNFEKTVDDIIQLGEAFKSQYPNLPLILIGHSYGSFLSQSVIQNTDQYKLVVLVGSAAQDGIMSKFGKALAGIQKNIIGGDKKAKLITKIGFGPYEKKFKEENMQNAWISKNKENVQNYNLDPGCGFIFDVNFYYSLSNAFTYLYKKKNLDKINKKQAIYVTSGEEDVIGGNKCDLVRKLVRIYKENGIEDVSMKIYPGRRHEILKATDRAVVFNDIKRVIDKYV